jgi:hypothetical protein
MLKNKFVEAIVSLITLAIIVFILILLFPLVLGLIASVLSFFVLLGAIALIVIIAGIIYDWFKNTVR